MCAHPTPCWLLCSHRQVFCLFTHPQIASGPKGSSEVILSNPQPKVCHDPTIHLLACLSPHGPGTEKALCCHRPLIAQRILERNQVRHRTAFSKASSQYHWKRHLHPTTAAQQHASWPMSANPTAMLLLEARTFWASYSQIQTDSFTMRSLSQVLLPLTQRCWRT